STDYKRNNTIQKTTSHEVLSNMERDLLEVSTLLQNEYRNTERIYPNRMAAKLLLARVYMSKQEWNKAENTLNEIVQSPLYQWEPDITRVFQKAGKHVLWQLKPHNNASLQQTSTYYFTNSTPNIYGASASLINSF